MAIGLSSAADERECGIARGAEVLKLLWLERMVNMLTVLRCGAVLAVVAEVAIVVVIGAGVAVVAGGWVVGTVVVVVGRAGVPTDFRFLAARASRCGRVVKWRRRRHWNRARQARYGHRIAAAGAGSCRRRGRAHLPSAYVSAAR